MLRVETPGGPADGTPTRRGPAARRGREIAAAATIAFQIDDEGRCSDFALHGIDRQMAGEHAMVCALDRGLARLDLLRGRLVTFGGSRDLAALRLATLRHRMLERCAAASWLRDQRDSHDDVCEILGGATGHRAVERFVSGLCGQPAIDAAFVPAGIDRMFAEFAAVRTMVAYLHVLAERHRSLAPLERGIEGLSEMLMTRRQSWSHLSRILDSELFERFAPPPF